MSLSIGALFALVIAIIVVGGAAGFAVGRRTATDVKRIASLEAEITSQREALDRVNAGINSHFEESAKLFGQLAQDYRAFFDHFTASATDLGLSERRAEAIRAAVETKLLADKPDAAGTATADDTATMNVADVTLPGTEDTPADPAKNAAG
jgi:uncharacterized membrane-anchored protein YhcB (DUF1043 family)